MKRTFITAAAALALAVPAGMAIAQDTMATDTGAMMAMTASQKTMYDGWPADRRDYVRRVARYV